MQVSFVLAADTSEPNDVSDPAAGLTQVGEARLSVFLFDVYDSRLFTADGTYERGTRPLVLDIEYLRKVSGADLLQRTQKEWASQNLSHPKQLDWIESLRTFFPDVTDGDRLTLRVNEDQVSVFYLNEQPIGSIDDPLFAEHFTAIWLSPDTSRPEIRAALLGKAS
ncbi:conserved hypothetical protein [Luminiphilus syltensis NOR5-1B]|uniref:Chalcone isomerase domain-containing protein n=2 Tax=Luminiphilus TaxID=1341118 RepID=B8KTM2_9GAMM|nr:conserved hypothetical protein [Luminiphilus syltensis NOR5-1B]